MINHRERALVWRERMRIALSRMIECMNAGDDNEAQWWKDETNLAHRNVQEHERAAERAKEQVK